MLQGSGGLLLAAVAGYWVLERAERHRGNLKRVGQLLGSVVILVSLLGVACRVWALATGKVPYCPTGYCPFTPKASSPLGPPR